MCLHTGKWFLKESLSLPLSGCVLYMCACVPVWYGPLYICEGYTYVHKRMQVDWFMCIGQRSMLGVFHSHSPPYFFDTASFVEPRIHGFGKTNLTLSSGDPLDSASQLCPAGDQTQIFLLAWKFLYNPCKHILIDYILFFLVMPWFIKAFVFNVLVLGLESYSQTQ